MARAEATQARSDTRDWARARRDRTRHLIELGGLVAKAGLVELVDDDRATLLGALLELVAQLQDGDDEAAPAQLRARWRHAGLRAFHQEREAGAEAARRPQGGGTAAERGSA
ncbi:conjugal transfer protein TraD [Roseomonas sp. KE2513]|uniref:conjugal transfer protein TraD n=1 Tax=Roseomonas sp. KE2513 TaxID=2479202 RepID=UPI0018DFF1B2|nr:conjugal transfer protein TraD [Roseomonas sp. KE2513]